MNRFIRLVASPEPELKGRTLFKESRVAARKGSDESRFGKGLTRATGRDEQVHINPGTLAVCARQGSRAFPNAGSLSSSSPLKPKTGLSGPPRASGYLTITKVIFTSDRMPTYTLSRGEAVLGEGCRGRPESKGSGRLFFGITNGAL